MGVVLAGGVGTGERSTVFLVNLNVSGDEALFCLSRYVAAESGRGSAGSEEKNLPSRLFFRSVYLKSSCAWRQPRGSGSFSLAGSKCYGGGAGGSVRVFHRKSLMSSSTNRLLPSQLLSSKQTLPPFPNTETPPPLFFASSLL